MIKLNKLVGVYKITNKENYSVYIGESLDIDNRWKEHIRSLNSNSHHCYKLQEDWNEFGEEYFVFEILEEIKPLDTKEKTIMELLCIEGKYIDEYDSINNGYNVENTIEEVISGRKTVIKQDKKLIISESFVKLQNNIYDNPNISNEEITVLVLLLRNYIISKSSTICSIDMIAQFMKIETSRNRKIIGTIKEAITGLVEKGYITKLYDIHCNEINVSKLNKDYIFYAEFPDITDSGYFIVHDKDINKIFSHLESLNIGKFNLIRYFIACRRVSSNKYNFGYLSQTKLKGLVTDSRSIRKYNNILQDELELIRYNNNYLTKNNKYCVTYIGKFDDKANFNRLVKEEVATKGLIYTNKIKSNERRSVQAKINSIEKSIDDFSIEELEALLLKKKELEYQPQITIEEQKALQEIEDLNKAQIPLDVLQMIENELNERKEDEE